VYWSSAPISIGEAAGGYWGGFGLFDLVHLPDDLLDVDDVLVILQEVFGG
jgi:hypothetical protein